VIGGYEAERAMEDHPIMQTEIVDKFIRSLHETAGSRFNAAKRLEGRDRRLTAVAAVCSVYIIVLIVLPYFLNLPPEITTYLNIFVIFLAIVILVTSLLQYSSNNVANSEKLHRSGLEIKEIERELELRKDRIALDDLDMFRVRYSNILEKYGVDHDRRDYTLYQIENREKYPFITDYAAFVTHAGIRLRKHSATIFLIIITLIILGLALSLLNAYPVRLPQVGS
jgi:hypothetical protein